MVKSKAQKAAPPQPERSPQPDPAKSWREAIESIVIAIILAFLFRAFEAEAFVIPTGSMAPTLQGRHKDVRCPECAYRYQAGASADAEAQFGQVEAVTCPACRYTQDLDPRKASDVSHTGDRILVNKFAFEPPFGNPQRWDVIVFKYPYNAKQNYIKRCVGLENEKLKIRHGDVHVQRVDDGGNSVQDGFSIARKPPHKLKHMLQLVHDTRYLAEALQQVGWPLNWQSPAADGSWTSPDAGNTYHCTASDKVQWLQFRQYYLDESIWDRILQNMTDNVSALQGIDALEVPVTDFYAYNAQTRRGPRAYVDDDPKTMGLHWVGDLAIEAELEVSGDRGQLQLMLIEAGRQHLCEIDLATGEAKLQIDQGKVEFQQADGSGVAQVTANTPVKGAGRYRLRFTNVDDQLLLWVNEKLCEFDHETTYGPTPDDRPFYGPLDPGDMHPARIGAQGVEVTATRLRVLRDIYYIATKYGEYSKTDYPPFDEGQRAIEYLLSPQRWAKGDMFDRRRSVEFTMKKDQFFAMGDNSPYSQDSRLWGPGPRIANGRAYQGNAHGESTVEHYVQRDLLIGKAVLIYWPHAWRLGIPGTGISLPVVPNVQRMGLIH